MNAPQLTPAAQAAFAAGRMSAPDAEFDRLLRRDLNPIDLLDEGKMDKVMLLAEQMATSKLSVPEHLRGNVGDCLAIVTQAMLWNMNPFAVAQKTHLVSGKLGYEAQLVIAVVMNSGALRGSLRYEYRGEGPGLECRVGGVLRGEAEITWGEWLRIADVTTKNSPLWKTNPRQQMGYLQAKNWARLYCPGAILGVYSADELADSIADYTPPERSAAPSTAPAAPQQRPEWSADEFAAKLPTMQKAVNAGKTPDELVTFYGAKKALSAEQQASIRALKPQAAPAAAPARALDDGTSDFVAEMDAAERGEGGGK